MQGLNKLIEIAANRQEFHLEILDSDGKQVNVAFIMKPGADESQIQILNNGIGNRLPVLYKKFLKQYNGARLYDYKGLGGFQFLGCDEIIHANNFAKATFEDDWNDSLLVFAKYIGECNYLAFDTSSKDERVIDCFFEELPRDWNVIASNFDSFLQMLIESEGSLYWL